MYDNLSKEDKRLLQHHFDALPWHERRKRMAPVQESEAYRDKCIRVGKLYKISNSTSTIRGMLRVCGAGWGSHVMVASLMEDDTQAEAAYYDVTVVIGESFHTLGFVSVLEWYRMFEEAM